MEQPYNHVILFASATNNTVPKLCREKSSSFFFYYRIDMIKRLFFISPYQIGYIVLNVSVNLTKTNITFQFLKYVKIYAFLN